MINFVFQERLGVNMHVEDHTLVLADEQELRIRDDVGGAVHKIDDAPCPQFPADLMSIALVVATQAAGRPRRPPAGRESPLWITLAPVPARR